MIHTGQRLLQYRLSLSAVAVAPTGNFSHSGHLKDWEWEGYCILYLISCIMCGSLYLVSCIEYHQEALNPSQSFI